MNKHDKTRYVFAQAIKGLIKVHPLDKIAVTDIVTRSGMTRRHFIATLKINMTWLTGTSKSWF